MHRRHVLGLYMAASFASLLMAESSFAQQPLKDQLVGAWTLVSASSKLPDGSPVWGANPIGLIVFTSSGHYSTQLMRSDLPKYASNNRAKGTAEEYKTIAMGSVANFGTYSVDEANKTFTISYDGSTFPNRKGAKETRPFVIEGDQLRITNPAPSTGGNRLSSSIVARSKFVGSHEEAAEVAASL